MDDDLIGREWIVDVAAASIFAGASGWSAFVLVQPLAGAAAAAIFFVVCLTFLRAMKGGAFALPVMDVPTWPEIIDPESGSPGSGVALPPALDAKVVSLFLGKPPLPSAGEMRERIEQHLEQRRLGDRNDDSEIVLLGADASAALREAIGELRRSIS